MHSASPQTRSGEFRNEILAALKQFTNRIQPAKHWLEHELNSDVVNRDSNYRVGIQQELDEINRLIIDGRGIIEKSTLRQIEKARQNVISVPPLSKYLHVDWSSRLSINAFLNELERILEVTKPA